MIIAGTATEPWFLFNAPWMGKSADWIPGRRWEFKKKDLPDHPAALNITQPLKICSGIFNVPSFGGAEMDQVLLEMKEGRQP